jgi:formylglycine-generating enzyme required for sulfatase activity
MLKDTKKETENIEEEVIKSPEMIVISTGHFMMGTSDQQIDLLVETEDWAEEWRLGDLFQIEQPQHAVSLPAYEIGKYPVTNLEYYTFVYNTGHRVPKTWIGFHYNDGEGANPVTGVSKPDCLAYCAWLSKSLNLTYRLPNEAEWEKASRGSEPRIFPWGDIFDPWRCNTQESAKKSTTPIGAYSPGGDSPYGVTDSVGNVMEWTTSFLNPYPYNEKTDADTSKTKCVIRGGAWYYSHKLARCSARESVLSDFVSPALGFRLARTITV